LVSALGALIVLLLAAGPANAAVGAIVVNTTADGSGIPGEEVCTGAVGVTCTLREAIATANGDSGADTISFAGIAAGSVLQVEEAPLPEIFEQVTIAGGTAEGAPAGKPAIELVPTSFAGGTGSVPGLSVEDGVGTRIEGLAIGGFGEGIHIGPTEGGIAEATEVCGNYLGVELDGEIANPNEVGVEVDGNPAERPEGTVIGSPGTGCAANAVVANTEFGIADSGLETTIAGNLIGIGPTGEILPNGTPDTSSAGILETASAVKATIGSKDPAAGAQNLIWFNNGAGVFVEGWPGAVAIRRNSFLENEGLAIRILSDEKRPAPTVVSAKGLVGGKTEFDAAYSGPTAGAEGVELDFYASRSCDESGAGEGQAILASWEFPAETGPNEHAVTLPVQPPDGDNAITATLTTEAGQTTEFSQCATYQPPPPPEPEPEPTPTPEQRKAPDQGAPPSTSPVTGTVVPSNGETLVVKPEEGKVKIKLPGTKKYVPLEELKEIPVGAVLDATKGKVTLTSIDPDGTEQSANFFGGVFKVKQKEGSGLVVLELLDTGVCPAARTGTFGRPTAGLLSGDGPLLAARPAGGTSGKLWGSGHGNFKTEGNQGSATVRGTIWLVEDRCDGTTFFKTRRGVVSVKDFVLHKTVSLPAGKSYVAGEG
jgi:CSLREA domain-containing protein